MIAVTGANGFVGSRVCRALLREGRGVRAIVRTHSGVPDGVETRVVGPLEAAHGLESTLDGVSAVIHLAAKVHDTSGRTSPEVCFRVNCAATERLAKAAVAAGVPRFVFASTVKVNGEETAPGRPFSPDMTPKPQGPYARSKWEAEQLLATMALQVAVVRPPLVYGPGVKANFLSLMKAVSRRLPLPLSLVRNKRSLVYVDNLSAALVKIALAPTLPRPGACYFVSDAEDLSTPDLVRRIAQALGVVPRLFPVPVPMLEAMGTILRRGDAVHRVVRSLQVDISALMRDFAWAPPVGLDGGLSVTADWFHAAS